MSHQTGTTTRTLSDHMILFMPLIRLARKSHKDIATVATVPALQCHGSGKRTRIAEMNDTTGSSG